MFRYLVLGMLRDGARLHGYALMKAYKERSGLMISGGNFYRELERLEAEGLVQTVPNPEGEDPRREPFAITEAGIAAFDAWLAGPSAASAIGQYDDELSSRALFFAAAGPDVTRRVLDHWQQELWIRSKLLEREREAALLSSAEKGGQRLDVLRLLLARRMKHVASDLDFLEEFRTAYEQWLAAAQAEEAARARPAKASRVASRRGKGPNAKK